MTTDNVMLAGEDGDFGLVRSAEAQEQARRLANEELATVYLRDPLTDEIIGAVEPDPAAWLPMCYFGNVDTSLPPVTPDTNPDDTLLPATPAYIVTILGFDPLELENGDDGEIASDQYVRP